jgi:hypothetical protein
LKKDKAKNEQSFAAATISSSKKDNYGDEDQFDKKACMPSFIES